MLLADTLFALGGRIPRRLADTAARLLAPVLALLPFPGVADWADTVEASTGSRPTRLQRVTLLNSWLRNLAWSLSLARWADDEVLRIANIRDADLAKLRDSLDGPGLVLALPHMGSWDFAGAWCARVGIKVASVAERLPGGVFERFRDAREAMGMTIYPVDEPGLLGKLASEVRHGHMVCLLSDRDITGGGIRVPWPGTSLTLPVPAGPALLARRTGADLRVVTCHFERDRLRMEVSDPLEGKTPAELMTAVVAGFSRAIAHDPGNWLMLRRPFE